MPLISREKDCERAGNNEEHMEMGPLKIFAFIPQSTKKFSTAVLRYLFRYFYKINVIASWLIYL